MLAAQRQRAAALPATANSADDILKAFQTYYETAELEAVTDPNIVYNLRAKLDATGFYDDFEVDRVAEVAATRGISRAQVASCWLTISNRNSCMTRASSPSTMRSWLWFLIGRSGRSRP